MSELEPHEGLHLFISQAEETRATETRIKAIQDERRPIMLSLMKYYESKGNQRNIPFLAFGKGQDLCLIHHVPFYTREDNTKKINYIIMCKNGFFALRFLDLDNELIAEHASYLLAESEPSSYNLPETGKKSKESSMPLALYGFHAELKSKSRMGYDIRQNIKNFYSRDDEGGLGINVAVKAHSFMASTTGSSWVAIDMIPLTTESELHQLTTVFEKIHNSAEQKLSSFENQLNFIKQIAPPVQQEKPKRKFFGR